MISFLPSCSIGDLNSDLPYPLPQKWITNGHYSDYFVTAVRTSPTALSMLLIPRSDAIETKIIKTAYSSSAGTALVIFEDALVPVENLLGQEGNGLKVVSFLPVLPSFS